MKVKSIVFLVFAICYLLFARNVSAQSISVGIDPAIIQINANSPALVNSPITVENNSDQTMTYTIFLFPFKASDLSNGQPDFDTSLMGEYKNIFSHVQILEKNRSVTQITLGARQKEDLIMRISLPKGEKPADYYFSVVFVSQENQEQAESSFVGARAGIGTNVLLSVGPKAKTDGFIKEFSTSKFISSGPVPFKLNVENISSHYITINGNIVIKNTFGQSVSNLEIPSLNILANSDRVIGSTDSDITNPRIYWNEKFLLGIYRAELTLALSEQGPLLKKSFTFFAFPIEAVLAVVIVVLLTIGIIRKARKRSS